MSLLVNPSFEDGSTAWDRLNIPHAVDYEVVHAPGDARSGEYCLRVRTAIPGGSMAQDVTVTAASVTALAHVRARGPVSVAGVFALWDLESNTAVSANFTAGDTWTPLAVMLNLPPGQRTVRVEIYLSSVNAELLVDNVNAF